jgi:hypothetical protein
MFKDQNQKESKLPVFNKTISIEVDVDDIHKKLMETFPEDYKHKEILSHAIVGSAMEHGGIGFIYNALNGYTNDVDFAIGEVVDCTSTKRINCREIGVDRRWNFNIGGFWTFPEPATKARRDMKEIGACEIVAINLYSRNKILVKYQQDAAFPFGGAEEVTAWVDHKTCTKWVAR